MKVIYSNPFTDINTDTVTNKTINLTNNTVTDVGTAVGDIPHSNGTSFTKMARGNNLQLLQSTSTDIAWTTVFTKGETTLTGNGSATTFTIAHGLGSNPSAVSVDATTSGAAVAGTYYTHDATNITVTFSAAPANSTSLGFSWVAFK